MKHIPARVLTHKTREFWWCDGYLHAHKTAAAALRCEAKRMQPASTEPPK